MADGVGVLAPTWWRRTTVDGVADGGGWARGCFRAHGVRMGKREVERKGEPCIQGALVSNARKFTNLPPFKISYITAILVGWG